MTELGIKIDYSEQSITWDEVSVPMKSRDATFENSYHLWVGFTLRLHDVANVPGLHNVAAT
jgi:hypothetical protein